jgi:hypothetical protein
LYESAPSLIVVVLLGFLNHPDLADEKGNFGNFGLHDQLYFLKWLQRNIGLFGGDKDNITVMVCEPFKFISALVTHN